MAHGAGLNRRALVWAGRAAVSAGNPSINPGQLPHHQVKEKDGPVRLGHLVFAARKRSKQLFQHFGVAFLIGLDLAEHLGALGIAFRLGVFDVAVDGPQELGLLFKLLDYVVLAVGEDGCRLH
jgi:hypothetical protein